ncbi:MAG: response regulator transcription factor [Solirubrobacterales bacterium]|nr:response regulator transcription factor [Solirubrobacterales bacterium]
MSEPALSVLAVDDEPPQLEDLARILRASPRVHEVETAASGHEAIVKASRRSYDAIFLDVRMPELDGLELARVLKAFARPPALVFVSAFDTSAVATFEVRALDFLMKPVTPQRVAEALDRVLASAAVVDEPPANGLHGTGADPSQEDDVMAVSNARAGGMRLLKRSSILYVMAYGDYLRVFADSGRYLARGTLADVERRFDAHGFLRVHRRYLANLRRVTEIRPLLNGTALLMFENGGEVPVARRHMPALRRRLRS